MEVGLGPSHIVLDGAPFPLTQKGADPQFSAHFYCRQTAGCIEMPLGMEVGLSPGEFVLDGDPASHPLKGHSPPHCIRRGPSSAQKGHSSPPSFRPMSVVATVAHLSYC